MKLKSVWKTAISALAIGIAGLANAQIDLPPEEPPTGEMRTYLVSAVLHKTSQPGVIKLVHAVQRAESASIAAAGFEGLVRKDFPEYSVATTLVSRGTDIRLPACQPVRRGFDI